MIFAQAIFALDDSVIWDTDSSVPDKQSGRKLAETSKNDGDALVKASIKQSKEPIDHNSSVLFKLRESIKKEWQSGYEAYNQFKLKSSDNLEQPDSKSKSFSEFIDEHKDEKTNILKVAKKNIKDDRDSVVLKFKTDS